MAVEFFKRLLERKGIFALKIANAEKVSTRIAHIWKKDLIENLRQALPDMDVWETWDYDKGGYKRLPGSFYLFEYSCCEFVVVRADILKENFYLFSITHKAAINEKTGDMRSGGHTYTSGMYEVISWGSWGYFQNSYPGLAIGLKNRYNTELADEMQGLADDIVYAMKNPITVFNKTSKKGG